MNKFAQPLFVLRIGLGAVFLYFGIDKFVNPSNWTGWIPEALLEIIPVSDFTFIYVQGAVHVILGVLLLSGLFTRVAAAVTAALMLLIITVVIGATGFNDLAVRDAAIFFMAVSLALAENHSLSLDDWFNKKRIRLLPGNLFRKKA